MNVLSLFDGMSCGQIALNRIGIKPNKYYASEIDKYAIKVTMANYPDTVQLGSVTEWREWDIDWTTIDLVTGGFPCQTWSVAGKQLGDKDERGVLFWVMLDIIKHVKTHNLKVKFLIENVKMKNEFERYITHHTKQAVGEVNKVLINSALVSAQNRNRYYWTNWYVEQPEDKGILLNDIIDSGVVDRNKSYCIDANYARGGNLKRYFERSSRQLVFGLNKGMINITDYRKLTPLECAKLQTIPKEVIKTMFTCGVSNSQLYKMLGNGWTVDVICHILKSGLTNKENK